MAEFEIYDEHQERLLDNPEYKEGMPAKHVIDLLHEGKDVFLTGGGGVGKTYLTNLIVNHPTIQAVKLASTGVAANLLDGMTSHRFFKLGISDCIASLRAWDKRSATQFGKKIGETPIVTHKILMNTIRKNLKNINVIVVDEVSMLSNDHIAMLFYRLLKSLKVDVRMLYVGDFFQLPPVDPAGKKGMAFESEFWKPVVVQLDTIKRTDNKEFAEIQHKIRYGIKTPDVLEYMDMLSRNEYNPDTLHLFSTNNEIDSYNIEKLRELPGDPQRVDCKFNQEKYNKGQVDDYCKDLLVGYSFFFKFGARILFVSNNYKDDELVWYNGEMGTLQDFKAGCFTVLKDDGVTVTVPRSDYIKEDLKDGEPVEVMAMRQFPLRIAYAISIHKSQGLSLAQGHIDCTKFFLNEQFFVAISRFTDPTKLSLVGFDPKLIQQNKKALAYYESVDITHF